MVRHDAVRKNCKLLVIRDAQKLPHRARHGRVLDEQMPAAGGAERQKVTPGTAIREATDSFWPAQGHAG
jgi:hypothetical protein